jgi:hypothetical protein
MLGAKAFVVCSRVDASEVETKADLVAVTKHVDWVKVFLPEFADSVAMLHGRMEDDEKNSVLDAFRNGPIKVSFALMGALCTPRTGIGFARSVRTRLLFAPSVSLSHSQATCSVLPRPHSLITSPWLMRPGTRVDYGC